MSQEKYREEAERILGSKKNILHFNMQPDSNVNDYVRHKERIAGYNQMHAQAIEVFAEMLEEKDALQAKVRELEGNNDRMKSALTYINSLAYKKDVHLGHPRMSDKECIFCMSFFAIQKGTYGYEITKEDYDKFTEDLNRIK
jgi:hypothetical protein